MLNKEVYLTLFRLLVVMLMLAACEKDRETHVPVITTDDVVVTLSKTVFKGSVTNITKRQLSDHGFLWDESAPTYERSTRKSLGPLTSDMTFVAEIHSSMDPRKEYFVRSYYVLEGNVFYGESLSFRSLGQKIPVIDSFSPSVASWGDTLLITGKNFSPIANENVILFGEHPAVCITEDGETLKTTVPASLNLSHVLLTIRVFNNQAQASKPFALNAPLIETFTPETGRSGTVVTISGKYFKEGMTSVYFDSVAAPVTFTSQQKIVVTVPAGLPNGNVTLSLSVAGQETKAAAPFVSQALSIKKITPSIATFDEEIIIHGTGFATVAADNKVSFGATSATVTEATYAYLKVSVPRNLTRSQTHLHVVNGEESVTSPQPFKLRGPSITGISPATGTFRDAITITGENFNPEMTGNLVTIGGATAAISSATQSSIIAFIPDGYQATNGKSPVKIQVADLSTESSKVFELTPHVITNVEPTIVTRTGRITIDGQFFNPVPERNEVFFGAIRATVTSGTTSMLQCEVPPGLSRGYHKTTIRVGGREVISNSTFFLDDPWSSKAPVPGGPRKHGFAFVIDGTAYVGGGFSAQGHYRNDMYAFDAVSNAWTKRGEIPVNGEGVTEFTTETKGYLLFGKELWQYDPSGNHWKRKADFPGTATRYQSAFGIGDKGYSGGGLSTSYPTEFYEYNEAEDKWYARPACPAGAIYMGTGFSVGGKGYFVTGVWAHRDVWEFDPATNQWRKLLSLLDIVDGMNRMRLHAVGISGEGKAYFATGTDDTAIWGRFLRDLYEFDPATNSVRRLPDLPGNGRVYAYGFYVDGKVFIGGGAGRDDATGWSITFDDLYEYSPE